MVATQQIPLDRPFNECSPEFKKVVHNYFYKILPIMFNEFTAMQSFGGEASLEAFELLVEEGGVRFIPTPSDEYRVYLFNLFTGVYEDVTTLVEELMEEDEDEDFGY